MKKLILALVWCSVAGSFHADAQIFKKLKEKIKETAEDHVVNDAGNATDRAIDKTESTAGKSVKNSNSGDKSATDDQQVAGSSVAQSSGHGLKTYANYDFVPGDKIIFESDLAEERVGEIPSQFTLIDGQADVQVEDGENVIHIPVGDGANLTARMSQKQYLPERFTVEFDIKNERFAVNHFSVDFGARVYYAQDDSIMHGCSFNSDDLDWTSGSAKYPKSLSDGPEMQWHHIAIAINKNIGKVYIDQYRIANVNNLTGKPLNLNIHVAGYENSWLKNLRIAEGGIDLYKETTTPAKIVMHGILFDTDKATLKPESMGSINQIYDLMKKDPAVKFEIDGHTDNSGTAAHNLTLSGQRADAVKNQLVSMGIAASRLTTKGWGDTKPIGDNSTSEGKANNRRVEFIKM